MTLLSKLEPQTAPTYRIARAHDATTAADVAGGVSFANLSEMESAIVMADHLGREIDPDIERDLLREVKRQIMIAAVDRHDAGAMDGNSVNLDKIAAIARAALDELVDGGGWSMDERAEQCGYKSMKKAFVKGEAVNHYRAAYQWLKRQSVDAYRRVKRSTLNDK